MKHTCQGGRSDLGAACLACVADGRRVAEVRAVMRSEDELDDVGRARILSRLERRLADLSDAPDMAPWQLAARRGAGWRGRLRAVAGRRWLPVAAGLAAAAAIALLWPRHQAMPTAAGLAAGPGGAVSELVVPAGARARASLADRAHITLIGGAAPARLAVTSVAADAIDLQLDDGLLLTDYDGSSGARLRIHAPGAVIEVTGTLFAVDAHDGTSEVSVAQGTVVVLAGPRRQTVTAGETWRPGDPTPHPLAAPLASELARHRAAAAPLAASAPTAPAIALAPLAPPTLAATAPTVAATPAAISATTAPPAIATAASPTIAAPGATAPAPARIAAAPGSVAAPPRPGGASGIPDRPAARSRAAAPVALAAVTARTTPPAPEVAPAAPAEAAAAADPAVEPEIENAEMLYARAEQALRAKRDGDADAILATLVERYPRSPLADAALYERARLAYRGRGWSRARAALDALLARRPSSFSEPAAYLACRIAVETSDGEAVGCLEQFRRAHPGSPHDAEALALLAGLAEASGGCGAAGPLLSQYLDRYPDGHFAADARTRLRACEKAPR